MNEPEVSVALFTTLGCHLCEEAAHLLQALKSGGMKLAINPVEIADDPDLVDRYGVRIPVVRVADRELGWPFNLETLRLFLLAN